jgi:RNA polymerase sigma factor (sigma-70 family)
MSAFSQEQNRVTRIIKGDNKVLGNLYKKVYKSILRYSLSISANEIEVKECVQDAFEIFYNKAISGELKLNSTLETFIIGIAKKLLLRSLDGNRLNDPIEDESEFLIEKTDDKKETAVYEAKYNLFVSELKKLKKDCQKIIKLSISYKSSEEIAKRFKGLTETNIRAKKTRCKKQLIENIKENPLYQSISQYSAEEVEFFMQQYDNKSRKNGQ